MTIINFTNETSIAPDHRSYQHQPDDYLLKQNNSNDEYALSYCSPESWLLFQAPEVIIIIIIIKIMTQPSVILATASYDHTIRFWEAKSGRCYRTIQYPDSVITIFFSFYY
ncbi:unnamed protein product [Dovyalis caffra]|uniref:Uncharacterized protein n=1 Tax=Dovyalis caffra TaxID=77055 RepID=A0AAV1RZ86_9ROSI|nr:unnamed protein product [Dovyalis caffra]